MENQETHHFYDENVAIGQLKYYANLERLRFKIETSKNINKFSELVHDSSKEEMLP